MTTYSVTIVFINDSKLQVEGVSDYGYSEKDLFYICKNGYKSFFNSSAVKFIGRTFDLYGDNPKGDDHKIDWRPQDPYSKAGE